MAATAGSTEDKCQTLPITLTGQGDGAVLTRMRVGGDLCHKLLQLVQINYPTATYSTATMASLHRYVAVSSLRSFPDVHSNASLYFLLPIAWEFLCCIMAVILCVCSSASCNSLPHWKQQPCPLRHKIGGRSAPKRGPDSASTRVELW